MPQSGPGSNIRLDVAAAVADMPFDSKVAEEYRVMPMGGVGELMM